MRKRFKKFHPRVRHYIIGSLKNEYFGKRVLGGGIVIMMLPWDHTFITFRKN